MLIKQKIVTTYIVTIKEVPSRFELLYTVLQTVA